MLSVSLHCLERNDFTDHMTINSSFQTKPQLWGHFIPHDQVIKYENLRRSELGAKPRNLHCLD